MSSDGFLARLRAAIEQNGGRPPGATTFYRASGYSPNDLWEAGFSSYGEACKAVGYEPNTLQARKSDDELFRPLATLARELGKFPPKGAFEVQRKRDSSFPSWEAFKRREKQGAGLGLRDLFIGWCKLNREFADLVELLETSQPATGPVRVRGRVIKGFVYLMRYGSGGKVYKIGLSDNVARRHAQISMMTPQDVRILHSIPTDDPEGIEKYWFARFEERRVQGKKELFHLTPEDVTAFKSRSYQ